MTKGKPLKVILYFAIPLYIGQLFQLCYSLIDTRIIGSALGEESLAAVGSTTLLSDLLIEFINGVICGFGIIISTHWGADNKKRVKKAMGGTIILGIAGTVLISTVCLLTLPQILQLLNVQDRLMPEASAYLRIIIAGLAASALYNVCAAVLRAIGDSFTPLIFLIISNVLNVMLDYIGVCYFQMGVCGAAAATVISQFCSAILCVLYMCRKYPWIVLHKQDLRPEKDMYKQLIPTGLSMGCMLSFVMLGSLALQAGINALGENMIVAHTGARKITMVFLIPFFVLGTALATYCGQNLGAGQYDRIKKGIRDAIFVSLGWCVIVLLIVFTLSSEMIQLVTASSKSEVLDSASLYLQVNAVFYFLPAIICILRNSMQGFGDSRTPLVSSAIEFAGKVLIAFLLVPHIGYLGVIVSEPMVWVVMVIPLLIGMRKNSIF
ncbi:MAG: MATE family efflux transporter [Lachnospiraceae bacterium]|nr:MATE family efflux transporter [Lachnospiraceae bacterium]